MSASPVNGVRVMRMASVVAAGIGKRKKRDAAAATWYMVCALWAHNTWHMAQAKAHSK